MSVNAFDPTAQNQPLSETVIQELLEQVDIDAPQLGLDAVQSARFSPLITASGWPEQSETLDTTQLEQLIRFFTLAEMQLSGWTAGEKSAVIPLVRQLKARGEFEKTLRVWIKSNTDNRFLPHGSLTDRL